MNKNIKYFMLGLLFCLIFIVLFTSEVYAITGTVNEAGTALLNSSGKEVATIDSIQTAIKNDYAKKFQKMAEEKYAKTNIIEEMELSSGDSLTLASSKSEIEKVINKAGKDKITIKFTAGGVDYVVETYNSQVSITDSEGNPKVVDKNTSEATSCGLSSDELNRQYKIAKGSIEFLNKVTGSCRMGLMGGSIGHGYNVGVVYSMTQKSLHDLMEKQQNGTYDYKNLNAMKTAFEFYYGPIAGKINAVGEDKLPSNDDEWIELLQKKNFISGTEVIIDSGFLSFSKRLSKEQMNDEGYKITDKVNFTSGVQPFKGIANVKRPDSVISYTMRMAYPYVFYKYGTNYKLDMRNLRIEENYYYCVYNDYIYERLQDGTLSRITDRGELGIERSQIFSYYQELYENQEGSTEQKKTRIGVILIAEFDEAVVDTTELENITLETAQENLTNKKETGVKYYGTGRKIGFNNGYSDLLLFEDANVNLMFTNSEGGKEAFVPKFVAFRCSDEDGEKVMKNVTLMAETQLQEKANIERLPILSDGEIDIAVYDIKNHVNYLENPPYFKIYVKLHRLVNFESMSEIEQQTQQNSQGQQGQQGQQGSQNQQSEAKQTDSASHYGVIIVRNNKYVNDPSLLAWLRTDTARSKSFVEADKLLALITGNFVDNLNKLTYEDWLDIQRIEKELNNNKEMWIVGVMNVMSILIGIFLIVFSVLICLAYWIDVLNTLTDFSVLQFISFGRMYPVATDEAETYLRDSKGKTKFVKFKDVLFIAFICCAIGILFMEVHTVVQVIVSLYNYIMTTIGGK